MGKIIFSWIESVCSIHLRGLKLHMHVMSIFVVNEKDQINPF